MPKSLLTVLPPTSINDLFVKPGSTLNFTHPGHCYIDSIISDQPSITRNELLTQNCQDIYKRIGVDLVTETAMQYPYNFITEKTFRPIANGRPFIILGPTHTLSFLQSLGFMTFSSIIDETYDDLIDPELRFDAVCVTVKNFINRSMKLIVRDIQSIESLLIHNQQTLVQLLSNQLDLFQKSIQN